MRVIIDTSSLISLVRYYLPFDKEGKLGFFLERQVSAGLFVILDKVVVECRRQGKGQVINAFPFLDKPRYQTSVTNTVINRALFNLIDNNFINGSIRSKLPEAEYQSEKNKFVDSADFAVILYAYSVRDRDGVVVVTEETGYSNDGKPFKKIPEICKVIGVTAMNLPTFLIENNLVQLSIDVVKTELF